MAWGCEARVIYVFNSDRILHSTTGTLEIKGGLALLATNVRSPKSVLYLRCAARDGAVFLERLLLNALRYWRTGAEPGLRVPAAENFYEPHAEPTVRVAARAIALFQAGLLRI